MFVKTHKGDWVNLAFVEKIFIDDMKVEMIAISEQFPNDVVKYSLLHGESHEECEEYMNDLLSEINRHRKIYGHWDGTPMTYK